VAVPAAEQVMGRLGIIEPPKDLLDYVKEKTPFKQADLESTASTFLKRAAASANRDGDFLTRKFQQFALEAMKKNVAPGDLQKGMQALSINALNEYAPATTETMVSRAYNEGRMTIYQKSDSVERLMLSAIIDSVTTQLCRDWDGFEAPKDSPVWESMTPPLHYRAVAEGQIISTDLGIRPIESIQIGDLVLTHLGRMRRVTDRMWKMNDGKMLELLLEDGQVLRVTDDHPCLTLQG
jgi:SPP1 gp7 family putative phage head morphogenesis protein